MDGYNNLPEAHDAPGVPASPPSLTSSIYSLQLIAQSGINAGKSLCSQHWGATVQSNVCFGNKITTYIVIHKYLHFIIVSANELASQSTQGRDSVPAKEMSYRILTGFLLGAREPWSLFLSQSSSLTMCKEKITNFSFACLLTWKWERKPFPKSSKTGRNKVIVHCKTEVVLHSDSCSPFLVSYKTVYILKAMLPQRGNVLWFLQHTKYTHLVPDRTTTVTNTIYSDIKGIPINSGKTRSSLISPWHQNNALPQGCSSWSPGTWSASPTCSLHPAWLKDMRRLETPPQASRQQIKSTWRGITESLLSPSSNTMEREGGTSKRLKKKKIPSHKTTITQEPKSGQLSSAQSGDSITWRQKTPKAAAHGQNSVRQPSSVPCGHPRQ